MISSEINVNLFWIWFVFIVACVCVCMCVAKSWSSQAWPLSLGLGITSESAIEFVCNARIEIQVGSIEIKHLQPCTLFWLSDEILDCLLKKKEKNANEVCK